MRHSLARSVCPLLLAFGLSAGQIEPLPLRAPAQVATTAHERRVPLEGAANFRDLGGYPAQGGRHVKWGLVYRSNHLASLTAADYRELSARGIRLVCDLRTDGERKRAPTVWQGSPAPEILATPLVKDADLVMSPERTRSLVDQGSKALVETYSRTVTEGAGQFGNILRRIAYGPLPSVTHCSGGKDRTGVFSAILLTTLGVPRRVVIEDYLLTGTYMMAPANLDRVRAEWQTITGSKEPPSADTLRGLFVMDEAPLVGVFDTIDRRYGSFDRFVRDGLKLTDADVAALKARLLE